LERHDWAYLVELSRGALSLDRLGEALAILGQCSATVHAVVDRLVDRGFVEAVPDTTSHPDTASQRANREMVDAQADFERHQVRTQVTPLTDRRVVDAPLREALFRHVVARRLVDELG
jgi:hypothetical protein